MPVLSPGFLLEKSSPTIPAFCQVCCPLPTPQHCDWAVLPVLVLSQLGVFTIAEGQGRLEKIVRKDNFGNVTKEHEKIVIRQFSNAERLQKIFYRIFSKCRKHAGANGSKLFL